MREHRYSVVFPHSAERLWALMQDYERWTAYAPMVIPRRKTPVVGVDIAREHGGYGHSGCQGIANREMSRVGAPFLLGTVGLSMMIPAALKHGTEEQKRHFIPGIQTPAPRVRNLLPSIASSFSA